MAFCRYHHGNTIICQKLSSWLFQYLVFIVIRLLKIILMPAPTNKIVDVAQPARFLDKHN